LLKVESCGVLATVSVTLFGAGVEAQADNTAAAANDSQVRLSIKVNLLRGHGTKFNVA
jgi:hypothetical protein